MHPDQVFQSSCKALSSLKIIFSGLKVLKLLLSLRSGLLDGRHSAWPLHCSTRLLSTDILSFKFELAIELLGVSLGWLSDIRNYSAHYIIRFSLMAIRSRVRLLPLFRRPSWMVILLLVCEELSDMPIRSDIILHSIWSWDHVELFSLSLPLHR